MMKKIMILFLLIMTLLVGCNDVTSNEVVSNEQYNGKVQCEVLNIVDGDTLYVQYQGQKVKVRLIGIDTPESVHQDETKNNEFGKLASEYTKSLLQGIEYVYLEFDEDLYDDYNRALAYVYTSSDGTFEDSLNYRLVNDGYAFNREFAPNLKYANELDVACQDAKTNSRGLWQLNGIETIFQ